MKRVFQKSARSEPWSCSHCNSFKALTLRILLRHYNLVHSHETNFQVVCAVEGCPAKFTRWNSLYKHVLRNHKQLYDEECCIGDDPNDATFIPLSTELHDDCEDSNINHADENTDDDLETVEDGSYDDEIAANVDKFDLQKSAASFLLTINERNKIPQVAVDSIVDGTRRLVHQVVSGIRSKLTTYHNDSNFEDILESAKDPFAGIDSDFLLSKYIKQNFNYVQHKVVSLGTTLVRGNRQGKRIILEKEENFVYIPILESLQQLLSNKRIASMVLRMPKQCPSGVYYDIQDGDMYCTDDYFDAHPNSLMLILYHDELEVSNPLGSRAGVHKLDMYYYTIGNISPKFRSKRCAIHLLAIANANLVKKYGIHSIMQPIISDLRLLYRGHSFEVGGVSTTIYGKVVMCTGDTLGQHYWGGFKEGVGAAFSKCRHCQCSFNQMQNEFREEFFSLRTKESYDSQCLEIEQAPTDQVKKDLQTTYGINGRSILSHLPTFDVTSQLPQDIMHTLLEGSVQYEIRLVLLHYLHSGTVTLQRINGAILSHKFGYSEVSDKPPILKESVFFGDEKYKLKYKAAQARLLLRLLPFILGPLVDMKDKYYQFLVGLIEIVQLIFSPVIKVESVHCLKQLIEEHLTMFKKLFPNSNIIPKQHYLLHIPSTILKLGPMVRSCCFGFESVHSFFKELARKQNFKNLPLSLAKRNQYNECCSFGNADDSGDLHPLFSSEKECGVTDKVEPEKCRIIREQFHSSGLLPGLELSEIYEVSWIIMHGIKFKKSGVIAVDAKGDPVRPLFGKIVTILLIKGYVYFGVELLETHCFDKNHQAYLVSMMNQEDSRPKMCSYESLLDFNVFHIKNGCDGNIYIPAKYTLDDQMEEHVCDRSPLN